MEISKQSQQISAVIDFKCTQYSIQRQVNSLTDLSKCDSFHSSFQHNTEQVTSKFSVTNKLTRNVSWKLFIRQFIFKKPYIVA